MKLIESYEIHEQLNKKIFDGEKLKPEVREKILDIVDEFIDNLWIKIDVLDIQLLGSNASYNYTDQSDMDIHIITNFELLNVPEEVANALYNLEKSNFNDKYDITIKGIPVELYVEDVNSGAVSNGVYSVVNDNWIKFPKKIINVPKYDLDKQISIWENKINNVVNNGTIDDIKNVINILYMIRKNSITVDGEFGKGNVLFKELRNKGLLDSLKNKVRKITSNTLSLESVQNLTLSEMLRTELEN